MWAPGPGPGIRSSASGAGAWGPGSTPAVRVMRSVVSLLGRRLGSRSGVEDMGRACGPCPGRGSGSGSLNTESGSGPVSWAGVRGPALGQEPARPPRGRARGRGLQAGPLPAPPAQRAGGAARTKAARVLQWVWVLVLYSGGRRVLGAPFLVALKLGFGNDTRKKGGDEMRKRGPGRQGPPVDMGVGFRPTQKAAGGIKTTILAYFRFYRKVRGSPTASLFSFFHSRGAGPAWEQVDGEVD